MAELQIALTVDLQEDLLPLSAMLRQRGVAHKIFEEQGRQVLAVAQAEQVPSVQAMYKAWQSGELEIQLQRRAAPAAPATGLQWRRAPVTVLFAAIAVAVFLGFYVGLPRAWMGYLTFLPFAVVGDQLAFADMGGQYWRFITPIFIHFGWLHIVFNSLWLWDLGSRVERVMGSFNMLLLFLVIALVSNVAQFVFGGPGLLIYQ